MKKFNIDEVQVKGFAVDCNGDKYHYIGDSKSTCAMGIFEETCGEIFGINLRTGISENGCFCLFTPSEKITIERWINVYAKSGSFDEGFGIQGGETYDSESTASNLASTYHTTVKAKITFEV